MLTTASCVEKFKMKDITICMGTNDRTDTKAMDAKVSKIDFHKDWSKKTSWYFGDLAILTLAKSVKFTKKIQPICLPANPHINLLPHEKVDGFVTGWGDGDDGRDYFNYPKRLRQELFHSFIDRNEMDDCLIDGPLICAKPSLKSGCTGDGGGHYGGPFQTLENNRLYSNF